MKITDTGDVWWKTAVVYCLDVKTFLDWNGDGCGDFVGLGQRIDYLASLGVTCLWLMPVHPAGGIDDGYDVKDYYAVDERLGTLGDFVEMVRVARDRGIRVILDLVVQHTSDEHPWFVQARESVDSPLRDFYIWRKEVPQENPQDNAFPGAEDGVWNLDEKTGEYYRHQFYGHEPDLNLSNPQVRDEIAKLAGFWLELGISGFRVDAVPFLLSGDAPGASASEIHGYLRALRSFLGRRRGDAMLLGEVNLPRDEQLEYFGADEADELTMQFDFIGMQAMYLSLARRDAGPLRTALEGRPPLPPDSQWANFVRNHDELTLDKLSPEERQEVFDAFGPEERMQAYGRGLRRRLPPMLDGDQRRLRMVYSLLFALPGTPVLFYGEEIGMGENLNAKERLAVRTPMQWTAAPDGGFSTADTLVADVVEGDFGPEKVNVEEQRNDPGSLLTFVTRLAQRYRECPELAWGDVVVLDQPNSAVLALLCRWDDEAMVTLHNFADEPGDIELQLDGVPQDSRLIDLFENEPLDIGEDGRTTVPLEGFGHRWLRIVEPGSRRLL
ncbi:alpha-amylase family protein [Gryllotalpicola ginsengisoli]|uniref:alpha-amylase family protein n=1 Tax=Gryllotalpicola ginsengisoli TaxID=444608 RepID=UPI0003B31417|nr:alpha-amylase family protein [Gryllotalpicola ginsengisoli]